MISVIIGDGPLALPSAVLGCYWVGQGVLQRGVLWATKRVNKTVQTAKGGLQAKPKWARSYTTMPHLSSHEVGGLRIRTRHFVFGLLTCSHQQPKNSP